MAETLDYRGPFSLRTRELTPQKKKLTISFLHIYNNNYIHLIIKTHSHKHTHACTHARSHTNKKIEHQIHDSHSKSQGQPCPLLIM